MTTRRKFMVGALAAASGVATLAAGCWAFLRSARFGRLPQGERLARVRASPNYRDGAFRNEEPFRFMMPRADDGRGGIWQSLFRRRQLRLVPEKGAIPVVKSDLRQLPRSRDAFVWFGHSSCLLQTDGVRILVDPVFYAASPVFFLFGTPFPGTDVYKPEDMPDIDVLVITHDHWDHLDHRTVCALRDRIGRVVCPLGVGAHFDRWGFAPERIVELDWQEETALDFAEGRHVSVRCLPSRHFSGRTFVRNQSLWASFLVSAPSRRVYFGGDGGYDGRFTRIRRQFPGIDLAVLENGQYNVRWAQIHTMPDELGRAMRELGAKRYVTVHHGKFCISTHPWDEPFANERRAAAEAEVALLTPRIGEVVAL